MADLLDKTIAPTPHRRQQARDEGHVAQSYDLVAAGLLVVGLGAVFALGGRVVEFAIELVREQLGGEPWLAAVPALVGAPLAMVVRQAME